MIAFLFLTISAALFLGPAIRQRIESRIEAFAPPKPATSRPRKRKPSRKET